MFWEGSGPILSVCFIGCQKILLIYGLLRSSSSVTRVYRCLLTSASVGLVLGNMMLVCSICARQVICCWVAAGVINRFVYHFVDRFVDCFVNRSVNHLYHSDSDIVVVGIWSWSYNRKSRRI